jgi:predicted nucleotidyltransferase
VASPEQPLDAERILRALADHQVEYVLIGGLAVQTHGHVRTTNDADLIPAPQPANLERLAAALRELEARVLNPGQEELEVDARMLPRATLRQFSTPVGGVDVMHEVPGGRPYDELSERALHVRLGDIDVPVVDLDDLIQMKLARARPVDLADVAALTDPRAEGGHLAASP